MTQQWQRRRRQCHPHGRKTSMVSRMAATGCQCSKLVVSRPRHLSWLTCVVMEGLDDRASYLCPESSPCWSVWWRRLLWSWAESTPSWCSSSRLEQTSRSETETHLVKQDTLTHGLSRHRSSFFPWVRIVFDHQPSLSCDRNLSMSDPDLA